MHLYEPPRMGCVSPSLGKTLRKISQKHLATIDYRKNFLRRSMHYQKGVIHSAKVSFPPQDASCKKCVESTDLWLPCKGPVRTSCARRSVPFLGETLARIGGCR